MPALPLQVRGQMSLYMLTLRCKKIIRHSPHPQPKHTLARVKWLGRHDHISVQEALEYNLTSQFESMRQALPEVQCKGQPKDENGAEVAKNPLEY